MFKELKREGFVDDPHAKFEILKHMIMGGGILATGGFGYLGLKKLKNKKKSKS